MTPTKTTITHMYTLLVVQHKVVWIISHGSDTTIFNTTYDSERKHDNIGRKVTRRKVSSLTSRGTLDPLTVTPILADFVFF